MKALHAGILLMVILAMVATLAQQVRRSGSPDRLPEAVAAIERERSNYNPRLKECLDPAAACIYGEEPVRGIIIGDSHADAVVTALQVALPEGEGGVLFRGGSGCPIIFGLRSNEGEASCVELNQQLEKEHAGLFAGVPIVLVGRTSEYLNGGRPGEVKPRFHFGSPHSRINEAYLAEFRERYISTLCRLAEHHSVFVMRPTPELNVDVPTMIGRAMLLGNERHLSLSLTDYHRRHQFVWDMQDEAARQCGVQLLDPLPYLCSGGSCPGVMEGRPLYRDGDHLSESGNRLLVPMFKEIFLR